MITKKNSYAARLGVLALALTLVTTCMLGGTLAKYATTVSATGTATVAKFDVGVQGNGTEFGTTAQTIRDLFTTNWKPPVTEGVKQDKLAPGVYGYFDIVVENKSEVLVKVSEVTFTAANEKDIPMKFAVTDATIATKPDNFSTAITDQGLDKAVEGEFSNSIGWNTAADANKKTVRVWWTWDGTKDSDDTAIGTYGNATAPTYGLTITIEVEQVVEAIT